MATKQSYIEIYTTKKGFRFRVKSKNSKTVALSETYNSKQACKRGISALVSILSEFDLIDLTLKK